jgi:hypothetical protein
MYNLYIHLVYHVRACGIVCKLEEQMLNKKSA